MDKPSTLGNLGPESTIPISHQGSSEGLREEVGGSRAGQWVFVKQGKIEALFSKDKVNGRS